MKYLFALAALLALAPAPKKPTVTLSLRPTALGTVWARYTVTGTGSPDSLIVQITPTPGVMVTRRYAGATKTDSMVLTRPVPGDSLSVAIQARSKRRGLLSAFSAVLTKTYVEPDVPPPVPTVDFELIPTDFDIAPGASRGVCGLYHHASGALDYPPGSNDKYCLSVEADEPTPISRGDMPTGAIQWATTCGSIAPNGWYQAPATAQECAITGTYGGVTDTMVVYVRIGGEAYQW